MRHPVDVYKGWQPKYAAYTKWTDKEKRRQQAILEMASEAGEVLALAQKAQRKGVPIDKTKVLDELGDTFWGLVGIMNEFNISFSELTEYNMTKLTKRNS